MLAILSQFPQHATFRILVLSFCRVPLALIYQEYWSLCYWLSVLLLEVGVWYFYCYFCLPI